MPTCEKHGHHAGICWRCAEENGRKPAQVLHRLIVAADVLLSAGTYARTRDELRAAIAEARECDALAAHVAGGHGEGT